LTARYSLEAPSTKSGELLLDGGLGDLENGGVTMSGAARGAVVGWVEGGSSITTQAHYLSPGGKPICAPTDSGNN